MRLGWKTVVISIVLGTVIAAVGVTLCMIASRPNSFTQHMYDTHKDIGRKVWLKE